MYKVLLVDDEPIAIEGLKLMIDWEKRGFRIDGIYHNGEEAIRHIRMEPPDLVVTDIRMPIVNGLELIEETRRSGNLATLFVITSGYNDFEFARRAMGLGVSHYMVKPIIDSEADEVLELVHKELNERDRSKLIRDSADRYTLKHALSVMLFGGEEAERGEAMRALSSLSDKANRWTYLQIVTEAEAISRVREVVQEIADGIYECHLIDCDREAFGLVLGWTHSDEDYVRTFAEELRQAMKHATTSRIGIAVGRSVKRLEELSESWNSAAEAERFLFYGGTGIVHYADIRNTALIFDPEVLKAADTIVETMENGSPDRLAEAVRNVFVRFEEQRVAPDLIGIFSTQVVLRCASVYRELGGDPDALLREWGFGTRARQGRHLRESAELLSDFCLQCQAAGSALQIKHTGGTTAKVADFLRRQYTETFTIKEIAERFYMNPVYLGQSFSRKYGVGILDFVHDLRIEAAKKLLRETDKASYAIAESVGYRGYQHFLKQFEKRLGMKPADYRLRISKLHL